MIASDRSHLHQTTAPVPVHHTFRGFAISLGDRALLASIWRIPSQDHLLRAQTA